MKHIRSQHAHVADSGAAVDAQAAAPVIGDQLAQLPTDVLMQCVSDLFLD